MRYEESGKNVFIILKLWTIRWSEQMANNKIMNKIFKLPRVAFLHNSVTSEVCNLHFISVVVSIFPVTTEYIYKAQKLRSSLR